MVPSTSELLPGARRPVRIFLVEDQALFSSLLQEILAAHPQFEVVGTATTATAALAGLKEAAADLVLIDLLLPDMSGLELIDRLMAGKPPYKILVCSAATHPQAIAAAFGLGVHGFVEKTCGIPELIETLERTAAGSYFLSPRVSEVLRLHARSGLEGVPTLRPGDLGILRRLSQHESVRTIAREVGLSESGVYKVRQRIVRSTGARSKSELFQAAAQLGLIPGEQPGATAPREQGGRDRV